MKLDFEYLIWGRIVPFLNKCKRPTSIVIIIAVILSVIAIVRAFT
jgi:hypothetical protein